VDPAYYFDVLYPLQDEVLKQVSRLDTGFYLTGGTAASRGYLHHRFSDDLDFFANDAPDFALWTARFIEGLSGPSWETVVLLREERFARLMVRREKREMKIEIVNDVPAHVGDIRAHPTLGRLDSAENILANKLTALCDREEPKDLADVWGFCCRMGLSIEKALQDAHSKAAGLFPADLARILIGATEDDWRIVQWIEPPEPRAFLTDLRKLGETLLLPSQRRQ
jgi:hypothetical protein